MVFISLFTISACQSTAIAQATNNNPIITSAPAESNEAIIARTIVAPPTNLNWKVILGNPPSENSPQAIADMAEVMSWQNDRNSARVEMATADVQMNIYQMYGPIIGPDFTKENQPQIEALFHHIFPLLLRASMESKSDFDRPRPFVVNPQIHTCGTRPPPMSSYPSGHSAYGWLSAQILARLYPDKASQILARGREFGISRIVCGVHFPSDVYSGWIMGDALLIKLETDETYLRLFNAARKP